MKIFTIIKIAYTALGRNKMRSILTMLGVIIGVGAVIAMVSIGQGAKALIEANIASLGTNLLIVMPGTTTTGGIRGGFGSITTLTDEDSRAIERECSAVSMTTPSVRAVSQVVYQNQNWSTAVYGVNISFPAIREWSIEDGAFFNQQDIDTASKVAVLGKVVAGALFGGESPIGQFIRIRKFPFKVVGVLNEKGQSAMGQDQDDVIYIPYTTAQRRLLGITYVGSIMVQAVDSKSMGEAEKQIKDLLRQRHRLLPLQDDDFMIRNMAEIAATAASTANVLTLLLGSIASVSLIVGGIGIMNIMLVSVTERTREIGIRMAVGARSRDILSQFLIEAIVLSSIGGVIGVLTGITTSYAISYFLNWSTLISSTAIAVAFIFSAAVGIMFGFYPAQRASRLDPIEALHHE